MSVHNLLEEVEHLIDTSGRLPWFGRRCVNEDRFFDLLSKVREALPKELEEAARVLSERDRILEEARQEAAKILRQAEEQSAAMVQESEILRRASDSASELMRRAEVAAQSVRADAQSFANTILDRVEQSLARLKSTVEEGRRAINVSLGEPTPANAPPATDTTKG